MARLYWNETLRVFERATSTAVVEEIAIIDDIVAVGKTLGLDVDSEDIEKLVEDHCTELTTKELVHLQNEEPKSLPEEMSSEEEAKKGASPKFFY